MFSITETPLPDFDTYWEMKAQHDYTLDELWNKEIAFGGEIYVNPHSNDQWGEDHRNTPYNNEIYNFFDKDKLFILDIGCGGAGFIEECVAAGHNAVGVELGVGYERTKAFSWKTIPDNLFIRDFGQPLSVTFGGDPVKFDFIHSWDVFEHIKEADIPQVCKNMRDHCSDDGLIVLKIATWKGHAHRTVYPRDWWMEHFNKAGLVYSDKGIANALREKNHGLMFNLKVDNG